MPYFPRTSPRRILQQRRIDRTTREVDISHYAPTDEDIAHGTLHSVSLSSPVLPLSFFLSLHGVVMLHCV